MDVMRTLGVAGVQHRPAADAARDPDEQSVPGMRIEEIQVIGRHRLDLGDLDALAQSIRELGLLQAIVVTRSGRLIAGQRRLEACRLLGWESVPVRVADRLDDAVSLLLAERDENLCRKDMSPEELVRIGLAIEEMQRPGAQARKSQAPGQPRGTKLGDVSSSRSIGRDDPAGTARADQETAALVGDAVGLGRTRYYQAKTILRHAEDPDQPEPVREAARQAREQMNATGKVTPAYQKFTTAKRAARTDTSQVAQSDAGRRRPPRRAQAHAIGSGLASLTGLCHAFESIDAIDPTVPVEQATAWERDLSAALRVLRGFHSTVKEHIHGSST